MKVRHAVSVYIEHHADRGLAKSTLDLIRLALAALLEPAMGEDAATLTPERMVELGALLRQRPSKRDEAQPLARRTVDCYLLMGRWFHSWALRSGYLKPGAATTAHDRQRLGPFIRRHREVAGMIRHTLVQRLGLADSEIYRLEAGRYLLTAARWQKLAELLPSLSAQVAEQGSTSS